MDITREFLRWKRRVFRILFLQEDEHKGSFQICISVPLSGFFSKSHFSKETNKATQSFVKKIS